MPSSYPDAPADAPPPDENLPPEAYAPGFEPEHLRAETPAPAPASPPPPAPPTRTRRGEDDGDAADNDTSGRRGPGEMGFFEHLEELRLTLIKSFVALAVSMCAVAVFFPWMFDALRYPLVRALPPGEADKVLNSATAFGVFTTIFTVIFCGGLALALPFIGYFVALFVAPGLTAREKGLLRPALASAFVLFLTGASLAYFFLLPTGIYFSMMLNHKLGLVTLWNAGEYFNTITWMVFGTGLVFEFPLVLVALMALGIVEPGTLAGYRRHAVVVILIIAAVVTPSQDLLTLLLMGGPMYALFEGSLVVGRRLAKKRQEALDAELSDTSD